MTSNNKPTTLNIPWLTVVLRADPDWNRLKHRELEYDFPLPGRFFFGDPASRGPYGAAFSLDFSADFDSPLADKPKG